MSASKARGLIGSGERPRSLDLVTGLVDDLRLTLREGDDAFTQFCWAWSQQNEWSLEDHAGFWRWALRDWPRPRRPASTETLAHAVGAARRRGGLTRSEAVSALGYESDSLRRMGVFKEPASGGDLAACVTNYVLPRIYANNGYPEAEAKPDALAYPNLDREVLEGLGDPKLDQLEAAVSAAESRRTQSGRAPEPAPHERKPHANVA